MLDTGSIILMNVGNESNTFGISFLVNRRYKQAVMNFEAADERICFLRMRGKFNNFTAILVHSVGQKSIGLKFSKSRTGCDVQYSCHHNSSPPSRSFTVRNRQPSLPAPAGW